MTILREREVRKREVAKRARQVLDRLPPEQAANVRAALRVLRTRLGGSEALAKALGIASKAVFVLCSPRGETPPGAGAAIRAAALAGVPVEDVLSGAWPKAGSCPMCGRSG